jgi:capsular polysaccharide biosynthesis protein
VNDPDETVTFARIASADDLAGPWSNGKLPHADAGLGTEVAPRFATLAFIGATIRRRAWVWCLTAAVGLIAGGAAYLAAPPAAAATTSLYITYNSGASGDNIADAILTDATLAQSRAVAALAVRQLGLSEDPGTFLSSYSATVVTNQILQLTVHASSSDDAVRYANVLAQVFLKFRAVELNAQQQVIDKTTNQQVAQVQGQLSALSAQITGLRATAATRPEIRALNQKRNALIGLLSSLQQTAQSSETALQVATTANIKGASVLDAATPVARSQHRLIAEYVGAGLLLGLVLGMGWVVIQGLASGRLRQRGDVALALGSPVKLSIGQIRGLGRVSARSLHAAARTRGVRLIVGHLRDVIARAPDAAALAVVPVDGPDAAALGLVTLAQSCARKGDKVILADLSTGAHAARLLHVRAPGMSTVQVEGGELGVFVPKLTDSPPVGPFNGLWPDAQASTSQDLMAQHADADLLLTLAELDPALGSDHLATWAADVVVVVTAGRSTATKLRATADMIRLARMRIVSAILVGADKADESLGTGDVRVSSGVAADANGSDVLNLGSV